MNRFILPGQNAQDVALSTATTNEWAELVRTIRNRVTYANVHTDKFPGGDSKKAGFGLTPAG